jgi:protein involved in polysaccharide export with SLBB domain
MNFRALLCLCLIVFCCFYQNVSAQINYTDVKVDQMTDAQVRQLLQRASSVGYSDAQLEQMVAAQGMQPSEISKLRARVSRLRQQDALRTDNNGRSTLRIGGRGDTSSVAKRRRRSRRIDTDTAGLLPRIFGQELFQNSDISFEPNLRMATPKGYVIGPDDELMIDITGDNEASHNLRVSPEGSIRIPYVGIVQVTGLTIEQATSKIRNNMLRTYPALSSGRTSLAVNLGNIRSIRITVIGEAVEPGTYTLSSLSTLFTALYACGGPDENGSFRRIQVIRNNKVVATADVYNFLLKGVQNNIRLQDQDVINIPVYQNRVEISGEVKRPALYEMAGNETLQDLVNFAGGFSSEAYTANIKVLQNTSRERKISVIDAGQFNLHKPNNGDQYMVETILNRFENQVEIQGAVFRPGKFALDKGLTLKGLITKADGLREDAFMNRGYVFRLNPDNTQAVLAFDVSRVLNGSDPDIPLKREDKITISSLFDLRDEYKIEVQGEVREPGVFRYADNTNIETAIQMAGGFKEGATPNRIEIARRVRNSDATSKTAVIAQIFTVNIDQNLKVIGAPFVLQPFDIITVRSSEGYQVQKTVKIEGEVLYPGLYTIQRKDEKISDLLKRAGGLTAMAFPEGASLKRPGPRLLTTDSTRLNTSVDKSKVGKTDEERERILNLKRLQQQNGAPIDTAAFSRDPSILRSELVGIDLKNIIDNKESRYDLLLEDGDIIRVPKQLQTVRMSGEVLKPTNIVYKSGKGLHQYISESGGFTYNAKKRDVYVEYANGSVKSTKKFLFFYKYPEIKPGAEVFVPKRAPRQPIGIQGVIGIATAVSSLAVIIVALLR